MLPLGRTMRRARTAPRLVGGALVAAALGLASPALAKDASRPHVRSPGAPPPSADEQAVVAAVVADTFPRPRREPFNLALCLDVRTGEPYDEAETKPVTPPPRTGRKRARAHEPPPSAPHVRGAPPELVARLQRPWRVVASALACQLDPRKPIALDDERHTPAQLVTVSLGDVAAGSVRIDWTDGPDSTATRSRDCTASRGRSGWSVSCGGTWAQ
jgi:hypothetical protein